VLISVAVAALALGITQGGSWGWTSGRIVASFAAAVILGPLAVRRARRHPVPAIDLRVFESRTVTIANAATLAYAVAFFAVLLSYVLFLTTVWHYSTLRAGLAITPGPLLVAFLSAKTGRLAARFGYRPVLVTGGLLMVAGEIWLATLVHGTPDYLRNFLPPALLVALGVAASFPVLSAAAVAGLPSDRFAAGGAINQTARQLGAVLGVALLVAILGTPASADQAVDHFHNVWLMCGAFTLVSAAISLFHRPLVATVPAEFASEPELVSVAEGLAL